MPARARAGMYLLANVLYGLPSSSPLSLSIYPSDCPSAHLSLWLFISLSNHKIFKHFGTFANNTGQFTSFWWCLSLLLVLTGNVVSLSTSPFLSGYIETVKNRYKQSEEERNERLRALQSLVWKRFPQNAPNKTPRVQSGTDLSSPTASEPTLNNTRVKPLQLRIIFYT